MKGFHSLQAYHHYIVAPIDDGEIQLSVQYYQNTVLAHVPIPIRLYIELDLAAVRAEIYFFPLLVFA